MKCQNCNKFYYGEKCPVCGCQADSSSAPQHYSYNVSPKSDTSKRKWIIIPLIVALVVLVVIVIRFFACSGDPHESPESVVKAYAEAYEKFDAKAVYDLCAEAKRGDKELVDYIMDMREARGDRAEDEIDDISYSVHVEDVKYIYTGYAEVSCVATVKSGGTVLDTDIITIAVTEIDGKWYVEE